ncbi:MAG: amidohydrolase [Dehalococcoidia bacterium]
MLIVDAQIHLWSGAVPAKLPQHRQVEAFLAAEARVGMEEAGVDAAIIHPPSWDAHANELAIAAAAEHPGRFAILGSLPLDQASSRERVASWKQQPGMVGLRYSFNSLDGPTTWFTDGTADWLWPAAEAAGVPVAILAGGSLWKAAEVAERHPGLRLLIDHLGAGPGFAGPKIWEQLPELIALAKYPNIAVKATGAPSYATEPYPFRDIHEPLQRVFDAFGPRRLFWGTDITRMKCSWTQCLTLFTEELPWLSGEAKELVMGRALCDWLDWQPDAAAVR